MRSESALLQWRLLPDALLSLGSAGKQEYLLDTVNESLMTYIYDDGHSSEMPLGTCYNTIILTSQFGDLHTDDAITGFGPLSSDYPVWRRTAMHGWSMLSAAEMPFWYDTHATT